MYMSAATVSADELDERSDIYSLVSHSRGIDTVNEVSVASIDLWIDDVLVTDCVVCEPLTALVVWYIASPVTE